MSKKSRKRNKKILGALAAGLGAMALMKRKKASVANTAANENANIGVTHSALADGPYINKKVVAADSGPVLNVTGGIHANKPAKGMLIKQRALTAGNRVPPSMRSGAAHAEGYQRRVPGGGRHAPSWTGGYNMMSKGGRVTGIAKRGFGRALMKGKK